MRRPLPMSLAWRFLVGLIALVAVPGVAAAQSVGTVMGMTAAPDYVLVGQPVTLEAHVGIVYNGGPVPSGIVDFSDDDTGAVLCGGVTLTAGVAACTVTFATPGPRHIRSGFRADATYYASFALAAVTADLQLTPVARLDRSSLYSTLGDPVTFTATLTGNAGTVPGVVDFIDGATPICTHVLLAAGVASCTVTNLAIGDHVVYGQYSGDVSYRTTPIAATLHIVLNAPRDREANVALATAGGQASAAPLASRAGYSVAALINGEVTGQGYLDSTWLADGGSSVELDFAGSRSIDRISVYTSLWAPAAIARNIYVEQWDGAAWRFLANVTGNPFTSRSIAFAPLITERVRISFPGTTPVELTEIEVYGLEQRSVALASTGAVASASSQLNGDYPVTAVNNNVRAGPWPNGGWWADGTIGQWPDWVQLDFDSPQVIEHVIVYSVPDDPASTATLPDSATFTRYGITDFTVDGWDGTQWVPLATVTGNTLVGRVVDFAPFTTTRIRVNVLAALDYVSRIAEIEVWGLPAAVPPPRTNWALASNGGVATASSELNSTQYLARMTIDGDTTGKLWNQGGGWADLTIDQWPDWLQVNFAGAKSIDHVVVYTVSDGWGNAEQPIHDSTTFTKYGIVDFDVMGWNGAQWVLLGSVHDNNFVKRSVPFAPFTTDRIRIVVNRSLYYVSRITEVQAWGP